MITAESIRLAPRPQTPPPHTHTYTLILLFRGPQSTGRLFECL